MKNYKFIILILFILISTSVFGSNLGPWQNVSSLNIPRSDHIAVLANDTIIYTLGGFAYTTTPYPVEYARIQPDGSLSTWAFDSHVMLKAHSRGLGFFYNEYIYALGGWDGTMILGNSTTAEYAKVNTDGTLSEWSTLGSIPREFYGSSLVLSPPYFYIIGNDWLSGYNDGDSYEIYRGTINIDGTIGSWTLMTTNLNINRILAMSFLINSTIYVFDGTQSRTIEKATHYSDGELGAFYIISSTVAGHQEKYVCYYDGEYFNVVGGLANIWRTEYSKLNSDGSLGDWYPGQILQHNRGFYSGVQTAIGAYVIGGWNGDDMSSVEYAPFLPPTEIEKRFWMLLE